MTYTVAEIAEILNLTVANVAYRLNRLGLKSPHDDEQLAKVRDYLTNQSKPVTIWSLVVQKYGQGNFKSKYQNTMYRWRKLGQPEVKSLEELDDLWSKRLIAKKERTEEHKKHLTEQAMSQFSKLVSKRTQKIRHLYIWKTFDPSGVWDDEVIEWYNWYENNGYTPCESRRLAYIEVLRQHHMLDDDEYFDLKESNSPLKMAFEGVDDV